MSVYLISRTVLRLSALCFDLSGYGDVLMPRSQREKEPKKSAKRTSLTLTPRQVEILRLIHSYRANNGCSPTLREMADSLRLSKVTVFEHVETLVRKGLLRRSPNRARSLTLDFSAHPDVFSVLGDDTCSDNIAENQSALSSACYPLVGVIAAGTPLEAIENPDTIDLSTLFETSRGTFVLRVCGESMLDEHIRDGDYVLVERSATARDGQIIVALLEDGEATLKKIYRNGKGFRLEGANENFQPLYVDRLDIQGVVIGVVRRY
jgi:repressor LexA